MVHKVVGIMGNFFFSVICFLSNGERLGFDVIYFIFLNPEGGM